MYLQTMCVNVFWPEQIDTADFFCEGLQPTFDTWRAQLEAATGVGVCSDEEEVIANQKGGNIGGQLRKK